jgi:hypothetical protein
MDMEHDLVHGRSCDGCTLCCKLLEIAELDKPRGCWCPYCDQKRGCEIYDERPEPCSGFYCGYRRIPHLDDRWKPSRSKLLINYEPALNRIAIHVDPTRPDAWLSEPFYSTIKQWAKTAATEHGTVVVWAGAHVTVVMPDRDCQLGNVRNDQFILPVTRQTAAGPMLDYELVEAGDPRIAG